MENRIEKSKPLINLSGFKLLIMSQTKNERLQYFFRHFSKRLNERYNLLITFNQYLELCSIDKLENEMLFTRANGKKTKHGYININNTLVRVYKDPKEPKALMTALPFIANNDVVFKKSKLKDYINTVEVIETVWSNSNIKYRKASISKKNNH